MYLHNTQCVCEIPIVYLYFWKCGNELVDQLEQVATLPLLQLEMNTRLMLIEVCFFDFLLSVFFLQFRTSYDFNTLSGSF